MSSVELFTLFRDLQFQAMIGILDYLLTHKAADSDIQPAPRISPGSKEVA